MTLARIHLYFFLHHIVYIFFYNLVRTPSSEAKFMMVLNPAPEGGLGASLRGGLMGLVQSDKLK